MNKFSCLMAAVVLVGILTAMRQLLGERVFLLAASFSALWFAITFVLTTVPPKMPEIEWDVGIVDRSPERLRDRGPGLPLAQRLGLSLSVANALCLLLWVSLVVFRR